MAKKVTEVKPAAKGNAPAKAEAAPAAEPVSAKPAAAATITLKQLAAGVMERSEIGKKEADALVLGVFAQLVEHLKAGERVRIGGLGIIEVKDRPARMGRNPATGAAIEIKASKKIAFRVAKELKDAI